MPKMFFFFWPVLLSTCRFLIGAAWSFWSANKQASHLYFLTDMFISCSLSLIEKIHKYLNSTPIPLQYIACMSRLTNFCFLPSHRLIVFSWSTFILGGSAYLQILITTMLVTIMLSIIASYQLVRAADVFCCLHLWLCDVGDLDITTVAYSKSIVADTKVSKQNFDWYLDNFALWCAHWRTADACCTVGSRTKTYDRFDGLCLQTLAKCINVPTILAHMRAFVAFLPTDTFCGHARFPG